MSKFHDRVRPHLESLLEPGEELRGFVAATHQGMFKGRMVAVAATDRRLIVLPLDRKIEPKDEPISIPPERIADAKAGDVSGGWWTPTSEIMDRAAARLQIKTTDGEKLKLMMMRGTGPGPLGELGGGEAQQDGIEALSAWLSGLDERP
jgi:hypothetical protein